MTQANVQRPNAENPRKLPRDNRGYLPRQFNGLTQRRYLKARRLYYLGRIHGEPTEAQVAMARSMAAFEWAALAAERQNTLQSLREGREHRRLLLRVLDDFERSLMPSPRMVQRRRAPRLVDIIGGVGGDGV
jgi:hypothetical protein